MHAAYMEAYVLRARGKFLEAEPYYRQILEKFTPQIRNRVPISYLKARWNLAENLNNQNRLLEAEAELRETLKEAIGDVGRDSETTGTIISQLGEILLKQGRLRDAEKIMRAGLRTIHKANVSSDSYMMAEARMRLGAVLTARQKFDAAMQQFDLARSGMQQNQFLYEKYFARNPALVLSLVRTGRLEEAEKKISAIYAQNSKLLGAKHYLIGEALGLRGMVYTLQEKDKEALEDFSEALPILLAPGSSDTVSYGSQLRRKIIAERCMGLLAKVQGRDNLTALEEQQLPEVIKELKRKIDTLTRARRVLVDEIKTRFPKYSEFTNPKPATISLLQEHLRPEEAFISIYTADDYSYVWAIPHEGQATFSVVLLGRGQLSQIVADLRKSLAGRGPKGKDRCCSCQPGRLFACSRRSPL